MWTAYMLFCAFFLDLDDENFFNLCKNSFEYDWLFLDSASQLFSGMTYKPTNSVLWCSTLKVNFNRELFTVEKLILRMTISLSVSV